jgi:hypothetical protein
VQLIFRYWLALNSDIYFFFVTKFPSLNIVAAIDGVCTRNEAYGYCVTKVESILCVHLYLKKYASKQTPHSLNVAQESTSFSVGTSCAGFRVLEASRSESLWTQRFLFKKFILLWSRGWQLE